VTQEIVPVPGAQAPSVFSRNFSRRSFLSSSAAILGGTLLAGPLLAACTSGSDSASDSSSEAVGAPGGAVTMAIVGTLTTLDAPLINTVTFGSIVVPHLLETFLNLTADGKIEPMLAESYEVASDQVTWTLHLRKNVLFHDGSPWNAAVAKQNLDRYLGSPAKFARPQSYNFMTNIKAVDDSTLTFVTKTPCTGTPHWLAWFAMGMHSGDALTKYGDGVATRGIGTGPFKVTSFVPNQTFTMARNDSYWGKKALLDTLNIINVPDPNGRATILQSGQAQISLGIPPASVKTIGADKSLKLTDEPSVRLVYVALNCTNPLLTDPKVRQALNYAVDSDAILKTVVLGEGVPVKSVMAEQVQYFKAQTPYKYDVAKAKKLLDDAGWVMSNGQRMKDGKVLTLDLRTMDGYYTADRSTCEAVQAYLQDVGVKINLMVVEHDAYFAYLQDAKNATTTQLNYGAYGGAIVDPTQSLGVFQGDLKAAGVTGYFQRYSNPKFDTAFNAMVVAVTDEAARKKAAEDAQTICWEDAPWIFLYALNQVAGTSNKVKGLVLTAAEGFDLTKVSISK
jgi:ABC-type transport system substrate-binding protein